MVFSRLILAFIFALCISTAIGHSYVTSPTSRSNQKQSESGCRGPACLGPCDVPLSQARTPVTTIARGASINVQWPRNNHAGGFIRFAWSLTSGSDVAANFDNGVEEIHCHEIGGCKPDDPSDPNGGDSAPADGSFQPCQTTITVPLYLTDGAWTLQWAWFGGAFALGDYYSCVDYKISGGPTGSQLSAVYYGGDYTYPGQNKCKFFNTDRLHVCVDEPCNNPIYPASQEESGPAFGFANINQTPLTTYSSPVAPISTGSILPLTTGSNRIPLTTGSSRISLTTQSRPMTPLTTESRPMVSLTTESRSAAPLTTQSRSAAPLTITTGGVISSIPIPTNCAGLSKLVDSEYVDLNITSVDAWSNEFRMVIQMNIKQDIQDWMLEVIWPSEAVDTEIEAVYNGGMLRCSANYPTIHSMIAPVAAWANSLIAGEQLIVELLATNTNMNNEFLMINTQINLFLSQ